MSQIEVIVGTLGRAHGLAGEIFVDLHTDSPQVRFRRGCVVWAGQRQLTAHGYKMQGGRALVRFDEITDRTAAEALASLQITARVDPDESPDAADEYYDHQLIGLEVVTSDGVTAGRVIRVDHLDFQDLLVVGTPAGERLVPFVDALVPEVDPAHGRVVVEAIPGLLEDAA